MTGQRELGEWHWYEPLFFGALILSAVGSVVTDSWAIAGVWLLSAILIALFLTATKEGQLGSLARQLCNSLAGRVFYITLSIAIFVLIAIQASMWL